jgi:predicted NUDIX family NTP pyrophosphohydrolase
MEIWPARCAPARSGAPHCRQSLGRMALILFPAEGVGRHVGTPSTPLFGPPCKVLPMCHLVPVRYALFMGRHPMTPRVTQRTGKKRSAGILMYRREGDDFLLLLVHPGGPFWTKKDFGSWSIPKGEYAEGEEALAAARREFTEETGCKPEGEFQPLGEITQSGGKRVAAWAVSGDFDPQTLTSNRFEMEWPPRSGQIRSFPEVDRAAWFTVAEARERLLRAQTTFIDRFLDRIRGEDRVEPRDVGD